MMAVTNICLLLLCIVGVGGYHMFTELIPNGHAVRHPCSPSQMWHGVGHVTPQGGGARNPFGYSFNHQNKVSYLE